MVLARGEDDSISHRSWLRGAPVSSQGQRRSVADRPDGAASDEKPNVDRVDPSRAGCRCFVGEPRSVTVNVMCASRGSAELISSRRFGSIRDPRQASRHSLHCSWFVMPYCVMTPASRLHAATGVSLCGCRATVGWAIRAEDQASSGVRATRDISR